MKFIIRMLLLTGLLFLTTLHQGNAKGNESVLSYRDKNKNAPGVEKTTNNHTDFFSGGKEKGSEVAYNYIFDENFSTDGFGALGSPTAHKALSLPNNYFFITARDDEDTMILRYGDCIRLWHENTQGYIHTHKINYYHSGSSKQQQVTILTENSDRNRDRSSIDKEATWWVVRAPHGSDRKTGQKVDTSKPIRLAAISPFSGEHSVGSGSSYLHSHNKPSPVEEEQVAYLRDIKRMQIIPKNEVTSYTKRDTNDNWLLIEPGGTGNLENCKIGALVSLKHEQTDRYLRSKQGVTFNVRKKIGGDSDIQHEVSTVKTKDNNNTTFKIAMIGRSFSRKYIQQNIEDDTNYKIISHDYYNDDNKLATDKERYFKLNISNKPKSLFLVATNPSSSKGGESVSSQANQHNNTDFLILKNYEEGVIGIKNLIDNHVLQHDKKKEWTETVYFENKNFDNYEKWVPLDAGNGKIYLQQKESRWFMAVVGNKVIVHPSKKTKFSLVKK